MLVAIRRFQGGKDGLINYLNVHYILFRIIWSARFFEELTFTKIINIFNKFSALNWHLHMNFIGAYFSSKNHVYETF